MMTAKPNKVFPLKVRRRHVLHGDGESSVESIVPCPRRGQGVPLATCIACEHSEGHCEDGSGRCSYLLCRIRPDAFEEAASKGSVHHMPSAADRTTVAAAMTANVMCVRQDVSIEALTALLLERGISGVPVVDANGFPIGVVSKTDLVREQHEMGESVGAALPYEEGWAMDYTLRDGFLSEPIARRTVADIMTPLAFTLYEHSPLSQAAALMAFEGVHRVPVVSGDGRVVGVLSSLDVMRWLAQHDGYLVRERDPDARR